MAISKVDQESSIILKVQTGVTPAGKPAYALRTLSEINAAATDSDVYDFGEALGGLQSYEVASIARRDTASLVKGE